MVRLFQPTAGSFKEAMKILQQSCLTQEARRRLPVYHLSGMSTRVQKCVAEKLKLFVTLPLWSSSGRLAKLAALSKTIKHDRILP